MTDPETWVFGDHVFAPFGPGSPQYQWLTKTLQSEAFQQAKHKIVMAHQSMFGLGENAYPVLAAPEASLVYDRGQGPETLKLTHPISKKDWDANVEPLVASLQSINYHYPVEKDVWRNDIDPLLLNAGVQLVLSGHSHL
ncbi:MAG: hypothetical protein ACI8T1_001698 [Verrucomicrobiales bacterium]